MFTYLEIDASGWSVLQQQQLRFKLATHRLQDQLLSPKKLNWFQQNEPADDSDSHLVVLVRRHCDELRLSENIGPEGAAWKLQYVIGLHYVEPRLVFVHRVQNCLCKTDEEQFKSVQFFGDLLSGSLVLSICFVMGFLFLLILSFSTFSPVPSQWL